MLVSVSWLERWRLGTDLQVSAELADLHRIIIFGRLNVGLVSDMEGADLSARNVQTTSE